MWVERDSHLPAECLFLLLLSPLKESWGKHLESDYQETAQMLESFFVQVLEAFLRQPAGLMQGAQHSH